MNMIRKLDFRCVPIVTRDQVIKQTRRQTTGLDLEFHSFTIDK